MKRLLNLFLFISSLANVIAEEGHSHGVHGSAANSGIMAFGLAYGKSTPEVTGMLDRLNEGSAEGFIRQDITLHITSPVRVGGGTVGIIGTLFDPGKRIVLTAASRVLIGGPDIIIKGVPIGRYNLDIREGDVRFSQMIEIDRSHDFYQVVVNPLRNISGSITGIPTFSLESPAVNLGSEYSLVEQNGKFSIQTRAPPDAPLRVICRMLNTDPLYEQPLYQVEWVFPAIMNEEYNLVAPVVTEGGHLLLKLSLDNALEKAGFGPIRQSMGILVRKELGQGRELAFRFSVDANGSARVHNIPEGSYDICLDKKNGPPLLSADVQSIVIGNGETKSVELTVRLPKADDSE